MEVIKVCSNEGPHPFTRGDNRKNIESIQKSFYPEPLGQFQPNLAQASLGRGDSSLFN